VLAGLAALCWLLLRSGARPSRLSYPCQQAALSTAWAALGAPLAAAVVVTSGRLRSGLRSRAGAAAIVLCLVAGATVSGFIASPGPAPFRLDPPADYRAQVFHVDHCPRNPAGDRFRGLDNLLLLMADNGLAFHRSTVDAPLAGPEGVVGPDDVVVVKINYQWDRRGGTNTDLLRGLLRNIFDHPEGFSGEVVVCENTQSVSIDDFDRQYNNAQDWQQSPRDVVADFADAGHRVSLYAWTDIRHIGVGEYADGDLQDGYVVSDYEPEIDGRVSYPKFQTDYGTSISLRDGIWDPVTETYDRDRLTTINVPVLKAHGATYGATACVKNYMGVVTNSLATNSHLAIEYGILGAAMAELRPPQLNILDCIWINAHPSDGPWTSYGAATRRDELVASTDPVAADIWAVSNILIPGFYDNGYQPPWPDPDATPDDPDSDFRTYLDASMSRLLAAGYRVTNDLDRIDLYTWDGTSPRAPAPRRPGGRLEP
jgi:hypothetical protein